jgi:hypothetical protein
LTFRVVYAWFAIDHARRRILHFDVTDQPTAEWLAKDAVRNAGSIGAISSDAGPTARCWMRAAEPAEQDASAATAEEAAQVPARAVLAPESILARLGTAAWLQAGGALIADLAAERVSITVAVEAALGALAPTRTRRLAGVSAAARPAASATGCAPTALGAEDLA